MRDESKQNKVTAGVGPVKGTFMAGAGVEDTVTRDADGKIIDTKKRGHNEGGLSVSVGSKTIGSTTEEEWAPRVGADGERVVDVTRKDSETDTAKFLDSLPIVGTKKKKDKGALATATGAEEEEDTSTRNVKGITLSSSDLKALASKAKNENAWINACPSPSHLKEWRKAASEINAAGGTAKAVEDALAQLRRLGQHAPEDRHRCRPGQAGRRRVGIGVGVPGQRRVDDARTTRSWSSRRARSSWRSRARATRRRPRRSPRTSSARLSSLSNVIRSATDFKQNDVKGEMMSAIASRQSKIEIEVRKLCGVDAATAEKGQERADYERLLDACITHQADRRRRCSRRSTRRTRTPTPRPRRRATSCR